MITLKENFILSKVGSGLPSLVAVIAFLLYFYVLIKVADLLLYAAFGGSEHFSDTPRASVVWVALTGFLAATLFILLRTKKVVRWNGSERVSGIELPFLKRLFWARVTKVNSPPFIRTTQLESLHFVTQIEFEDERFEYSKHPDRSSAVEDLNVLKAYAKAIEGQLEVRFKELQ